MHLLLVQFMAQYNNKGFKIINQKTNGLKTKYRNKNYYKKP